MSPAPRPAASRPDVPGAHALVVARTLLVAVTSLVLAAGAHALCGGGLPGGLGLVVVAAAAALTGALCARARLRAALTVPALLALQLLAHTAFSVLSAPGPTTSLAPARSLPSHAGHLAHGGPAVPGATPMTGGGVAVGHGAHGHGLLVGLTGAPADRAMLAAHLAATLAVAVLLVAGDAAAVRAFRWWACVLPTVLAVVARPLPRLGRALFPHPAPRPSRGRVVAGPLLRRGPPFVLA